MKLSPKHIRPLYDQVKDLLREQIGDGTLPVHTPLPSQEELARKLGVSDMTVRRALIELTQEGWLQRIRGKGTFVRERQSAPAAERACITVIANFDLAEMRASLFYHRIFQSMHQVADASGAFLSIRKVTQPHAEFVTKLQSQKVSGVVLLGIVDDELLCAVQQSGIPAVLLDSAAPTSGPLDEVNHSDESAAYQAVRELTQLGHEHIGIYVPADGSLFFQQRLAGYRRALKSAGIEPNSRRNYNVLLNSHSAYAQTVKVLQESERCTALFCTIDELAIGALAAVRDHGLFVPDDISIVGFGDIGLFSVPALSTVRLPMEQMGAVALQTLLRRIQEPMAENQRVILNSEWIARGSTGFPRVKSRAMGAN